MELYALRLPAMTEWSVCYPARSNVVVAVTAAGKLGSWPDGAMNGRSVANKPKPVNGLFFRQLQQYRN